MSAKFIDSLDIETWKYDYIKCAMAIYPMINDIKNLIYNSREQLVIVSADDLIKEMGDDFEGKIFSKIYPHLKYIMTTHRIVMTCGFHISGKRVLIMRFMTYKDRIPKCWKKRSRFLKRLMKSDVWKERVESKTEQRFSKEKTNVLA